MRCKRCEINTNHIIEYRCFDSIKGNEVIVNICGPCDDYISNAVLTHIVQHKDITLVMPRNILTNLTSLR